MKSFKSFISEQKVSDDLNNLQQFSEELFNEAKRIFEESLEKSLVKAMRDNFEVKDFSIEQDGFARITRFIYKTWAFTLSDDTKIKVQTNSTGYKLLFELNGREHGVQKGSISTFIAALKKDIKNYNKAKT